MPHDNCIVSCPPVRELLVIFEVIVELGSPIRLPFTICNQLLDLLRGSCKSIIWISRLSFEASRTNQSILYSLFEGLVVILQQFVCQVAVSLCEFCRIE